MDQKDAPVARESCASAPQAGAGMGWRPSASAPWATGSSPDLADARAAGPGPLPPGRDAPPGV